MIRIHSFIYGIHEDRECRQMNITKFCYCSSTAPFKWCCWND